MRTRAEIEKERDKVDFRWSINDLKLEVLLDIRELLGKERIVQQYGSPGKFKIEGLIHNPSGVDVSSTKAD